MHLRNCWHIHQHIVLFFPFSLFLSLFDVISKIHGEQRWFNSTKFTHFVTHLISHSSWAHNAAINFVFILPKALMTGMLKCRAAGVGATLSWITSPWEQKIVMILSEVSTNAKDDGQWEDSSKIFNHFDAYDQIYCFFHYLLAAVTMLSINNKHSYLIYTAWEQVP